MKNLACLLSVCLIFQACSSSQLTSTTPEEAQRLEQFSESGAIVVARKIPLVDKTLLNAPSALGFLPFDFGEVTEPTILINREAGEINFSGFGKNAPSSIPLQHEINLEPGQYEVILTSSSPVWHASSEYYARKNLKAPAEGSAERFIPNALGELAIFLNSELALPDGELAIHSGDEQLDTVSTLQLPKSVMRAIFDRVKPGQVISVQ